MQWKVVFLAIACLVVFVLGDVPSTPASSNADSDYDEYSDETPKKRKGKVGGGVVCPPLSLTNGRVRLRSRGRIAKFLCRVGFQAFGKRFATCIRGRWNAQPPICISRGCPTFVPPRNGRMAMEYRGALLNFACNPGFTLVGSRSLYCDGTKWNSTAPNCEVSVKNPQLNCDFERDDLCGWSHDPTHDFEWKRFNLVTPSGHVGTGPSHDHTLGEGRDGYYMYVEASSPRVENDTARLFSPVYTPTESQNACFRFWYHMYGATSGFLRVYVKPASSDFSSLLPKFSVGGDQGNKWHFGFVAISPLAEPFQMVVEGIRGPSYVSDTAIDDVQLTSGSECIQSDYNSTLTSTSDGPDVGTVSTGSALGTETTEMPTSHSGAWPSSLFGSVTLSTANSALSTGPISVAQSSDLQTVTLSTDSSSTISRLTSVPSATASVGTVATAPSEALSSMAATSALTPTLLPIRTLPSSAPATNTTPAGHVTSARRTFPSTKMTRSTAMPTTSSQRSITTTGTLSTAQSRTTLTPSGKVPTSSSPVVNVTLARKPTVYLPKLLTTVSSTWSSAKPTEPPSRVERFTTPSNQWTKIITSGPLSLKNTTIRTTTIATTATTTTTTATRSTPKMSQKPTTRTMATTTRMPTSSSVATTMATDEPTPSPTDKSNEIEIFPEETEVSMENGDRGRPPPPWTYMTRPSADRESSRAFGNVAAAAHMASGQFSVATTVGIGVMLVIALALVILLARRVRRRNVGGQEALNEDSDVRYLKDGEVRVEFCDLHLRYIGREDDCGL